MEELGKRVRGTSLPHSSSSSDSGSEAMVVVNGSGTLTPAGPHHGSSSPHDSGIQTTNDPLDEANDLLVDLHELIKNLDFMVCVCVFSLFSLFSFFYFFCSKIFIIFHFTHKFF